MFSCKNVCFSCTSPFLILLNCCYHSSAQAVILFGSLSFELRCACTFDLWLPLVGNGLSLDFYCTVWLFPLCDHKSPWKYSSQKQFILNIRFQSLSVCCQLTVTEALLHLLFQSKKRGRGSRNFKKVAFVNEGFGSMHYYGKVCFLAHITIKLNVSDFSKHLHCFNDIFVLYAL